MAITEFQKKVEELLRSLTLEQIIKVAKHCHVVVGENDTWKQVMRKIEDVFDAETDEVALEKLLRNLPVPDSHRASYEQLLKSVQPRTTTSISVGSAFSEGGKAEVERGC